MKTREEIKEILISKAQRLKAESKKYKHLESKYIYFETISKIKMIEDILEECGFLDDGEYGI